MDTYPLVRKTRPRVMIIRSVDRNHVDQPFRIRLVPFLMLDDHNAETNGLGNYHDRQLDRGLVG
jgi:hypothetical protein